MTIDHIAMYVQDLEGMRQYYSEYFGGVAGSRYHNHSTGLQSYLIQFPEGAKLKLLHRPEVELCETQEEYGTGYCCVSFSLGSEDAVDRMTMRMLKDGFTVAGMPRSTGDGSYESCVLDPEGNRVALVV